MTGDAIRRAERCFALARSTTFVPERDTAIARGLAIAEAAGLNLDAFDIPGRAKTRRTATFRPTNINRPSGRAPKEYSVDEIGDLMRAHLDRMMDAIIEAEFFAGAAPGESAYDARRRNFDAACAAAKARDAAREARP